LAYTFDFSSGKIFGPPGIVLAIYDLHNDLGTISLGYLNASTIDMAEFDWIIIHKLALKRYYLEPKIEITAAPLRLATESTPDYDKIYESDSLLVFKLRR